MPPQATPPGTKGRILTTALVLFAQRGFHGTSIRDLTQELGLQPGAFYVHYPSKEHVLAELVRLGHEEHLRALRTAVLNSGADPVEQMRALVSAHARIHAEYAMLAVVIHDELHALPPELDGASRALREQAVALLTEVLERGIALARFHVPHRFVALAAISAMGVRVAHWYSPAFELSPEQIGDIHAELAIRLLGGKS